VRKVSKAKKKKPCWGWGENEVPKKKPKIKRKKLGKGRGENKVAKKN
jgi:hypothetical protein